MMHRVRQAEVRSAGFAGRREAPTPIAATIAIPIDATTGGTPGSPDAGNLRELSLCKNVLRMVVHGRQRQRIGPHRKGTAATGGGAWLILGRDLHFAEARL